MRLVTAFLAGLAVLTAAALASQPRPIPTPIPFDGRNISNDGAVTPVGPPIISNSPGVVVGSTYYAYQTNGSTGNRIVRDSQGGIHIAFMKGTASGGRPRFVYYNFRDETGVWLGESEVSGRDGTGFVTLDVLGDDRAIPGYHWADNPDGASPLLARDVFRGFGLFEEFDIEAMGEYIWPYIARDTNGRIHMVCSDFNSNNFLYTYSDDDGETWQRFQPIGSSSILSVIIVSSPVSPKSAVVYTKDNNINGYDVFYFETTDGSNWNWGDPTNITQFTVSDSASAWADVDAIYDYNDHLHIAYQAQLSDGTNVYVAGDIRHWSAETGHSVITTHETDCAPINYCTCLCKMSLGVDPDNNNLLALWSELTEDDVSAAGYSNGELWAAGSLDGGATWGPPVNLTNSPSPGCAPPDCDSDVWSSMAETVDSLLHIMYVDDNDAGAEWNNEGVWTLNNVLYLEVDEYEVVPVGIFDQNPDLPFDFSLSQNYPNPFNARTVISVEGDFGSGELVIYDVTGRRVKSFDLSEETRSITWDGTDTAGQPVASGTYFYSVIVDGYGTAAVKKMTLLK